MNMTMTTRPTGKTILLVEDEPPIRRLIRRMLEGHGYQLLEGCNGRAGLSLAEEHRGPIDLLVTDVVMPYMTGFTLSERLVASHPETRVLLLSGYADQSQTVRGGLKDAGRAFLLKPFTRDGLLRAIRDQLDTAAGGGPARSGAPSSDGAPDSGRRPTSV